MFQVFSLYKSSHVHSRAIHIYQSTKALKMAATWVYVALFASLTLAGVSTAHSHRYLVSDTTEAKGTVALNRQTPVPVHNESEPDGRDPHNTRKNDHELSVHDQHGEVDHHEKEDAVSKLIRGEATDSSNVTKPNLFIGGGISLDPLPIGGGGHSGCVRVLPDPPFPPPCYGSGQTGEEDPYPEGGGHSGRVRLRPHPPSYYINLPPCYDGSQTDNEDPDPIGEGGEGGGHSGCGNVRRHPHPPCFYINLPPPPPPCDCGDQPDKEEELHVIRRRDVEKVLENDMSIDQLTAAIQELSNVIKTLISSITFPVPP